MGFYFNQKDLVLNPITVLYWLQPVDRDSRPQLEVGRPSRSTDVHRRARLDLADGRATDPVDRN